MYSGDGLPQKVCFGCVAKLETAYEFKLQVEQADKVLRSKSETLDIKEKFFSEEGVSAEADNDNGVDESYMDDSFVDMDDDAEKTIENENCTTLKVFKPTHTDFEEVNCLSVEDDKNTQCDDQNRGEQNTHSLACDFQQNQSSEVVNCQAQREDGKVCGTEKVMIEPEQTMTPAEDPLKCTDNEEILVEQGNSQNADINSETITNTMAYDQDSDEENYFKHLNLRSRSKKLPADSSDPDKVFFICYFCDKQFLSKNILKEHMYSHEEVRRSLSHKGTVENKKTLPSPTDTTPLKITPTISTPVKNKICEQISIPSGKKLNKCPHCGKEYLYISSYTKHLKQHESEKDIEKDDPMPLEILFHEDESSLDFENCNQKKLMNSGLKPVEKKVTEVIDPDDNKLDERIEELVMYACKECEDKFFEKKDLFVHLLTHDISLKCKICQEEFILLDSWQAHCFAHVQEGNLSSYDNEGAEDTKINLLKESKDDDYFGFVDTSKNDNWTEVKELKCPECPMTYSHRRSASRHLETHLGKKHPCEICGLGFTRKDHLQRHMETHTGTKYHCTVCSKEFTRKDHLQRHLKQHPKVVPYRCTQCNKSFGNKLTLKNHLKVSNHKTASFEPDFESNTRSMRVAAKAAKEFIDLISVELQGDFVNDDDDDDELWTASGESHSRKEEGKLKKSNVRNESENTTKSRNVLQTNHKKQLESRTKRKTPSDIDKEEIKNEKDVENDNSDYESGFDMSMNTYECSTCNKSYSTKKSLMRHQLVHEEPNFQCDICGLKIYRKDKFNEHYEKCCGKNPDKVTKCNICGDSFDNNDLLREHKSTHVAEGVLSEEDLKSIEIKVEDKISDVKVIRKRRTDIVGLKCPECNKQYNTRKNLLRHVQIHKDKQFSCNICPKKFFRREHLKVHLAKHKIVKPYACEICSKRFVKEEQLANHMSRHDGFPKKSKNTNGLKRFLCEICSKTFTQSTTLVAHLRAHRGIKPYVCKECSRPFTTKAYLRMHMRTHTKERPYICQYCSKAFARADTLANHVTQHTGEAKYQCKFCQKNFRRLKNLKEHIFIHTGQRPYACPTCDRRFSNNGSRYAHRKRCQLDFLENQNRNEEAEAMTEEVFRQHMHERFSQTFTQL
uniref:Protein krueppel n=1 Tax=Homalodisca liturata TaxID=320908 RepID=A0A1B6J6N9_9HEMI